MEHFKAVKITDKVYWVGAIDWNIRDFHGYATGRGTTYNAYLLLGDKVTLIDTVKAPFRDEMLSRIASLVDPTDIKVIISNHSEMDHTGCLPEMIDLIKPEKSLRINDGEKKPQLPFSVRSRRDYPGKGWRKRQPGEPPAGFHLDQDAPLA